MIERAAQEGDPEGNAILARWYLYGSDRPRDLAAAHRCLELAAGKGNHDATRLLAHLIASGTGCAPDQAKALKLLRRIEPADPSAAEEISLFGHMRSDEAVASAKMDLLSEDPCIKIYRGLLTAEECAYLIRRSEPLLKPSLVDDPIRGRGVPDPIRTSLGATFVPHDEDIVMQAINRRFALATGTDVRQGEALYVMRYAPGQQYRPHHDALGGLRNQRSWTAIAYLNDDYEGGTTVFPDLSISIRADPGDVLAFANLDGEGRPHPLMLHAGMPVTRGAKWIATRWIRQTHHDPYDRG